MSKDTKFKQTRIGLIPEDWEVKELREVGIILIDCVHKTPNEEKEGFPYIAIPQMKQGHIDFSNARLISKTDLVYWTKKAKPQKYDIILSRRCNPGETAYVKNNIDFALGQNLVLLRSNNKEVYQPFLRWLARSKYWWAQVNKYINVGAVFESLKCVEIPLFKVPIPHFKEQKTIAKVLSDLDSKIELLQKQNKTLEQIGQAIFKQWFVDFEFPNNEGKPYSSSGGKIIKREFEEIPEGWSVGHLDDGQSSVLIKTGINQFDNEKTYLATACVEGKNITNTFTKITMTEKPSRANMQPIPNSIWFAKMKDSKKVLLINSHDNWILDNVILSTGFLGIKPLNNMLYYLWIIISSNKFEIEKDSLCLGTTMQAVNNESIRKIEYLIPKTELITDFNKIVENNFKKISINKSEITNLQKSRDLLLPKLLNGQIRVPLEVAK